jgi:hypothetical protein
VFGRLYNAVTIHLIGVVVRFDLAGDGKSLAFSSIKAHLPLVSPLEDFIQIILENILVISALDLTV